MALLFHEGIPGCGKTYEAVVKHLIPALKKGRKCYARIDGLNFDKLAELAGITPERCRELLVLLSEDDVKALALGKVDTGSLVLIDEIQNYFPDTRGKLPDHTMKFVAEQRHEGLDIIAMGQDLKDVHKVWRRRVDQKVLFHKLDMLGSKKYRWKLYKAVGPEKFSEVSSGTEEYDAAIFGSYKSFNEGAEGAQKYDDKRASIWASPVFRKWLPITGVLAIAALFYLFHLFKGGGLASSVVHKEPEKSNQVASANSSSSSPSLQVAGADVGGKKNQRDPVVDLSERYRFRVSGIVKNASKLTALFEWYDESLHVRERLTMQAVQLLGWNVLIDEGMNFAVLTKDGQKYTATQFPLETFGNVSQEKQRQIAGGKGYAPSL